ncbi:MAG: PHP domain-containing protein [Elusimicrobia bacterium]|nr:PHP domain-containing protein [Elusimicrobiota bacterium]
MKKVDLHTHSRYSDGTSAPEEVVARAKAARVELLFLTDHDTVAGFPEAAAAAAGSGVEVRCGIEINSIEGSTHILGYGIRWKDSGLLARLSEFRERRAKRVRLIIEKLAKKGISLSFDDVASGTRETLGRPHVADALRRQGVVKSRQEAFDRFLTPGKPGYVESMDPTAEEAITLIRDAGGFCSVAHPDTVCDKARLEDWAKKGLEGLEVYYSTHTPSDIIRYAGLAERFGLLATGGTDYHGPGSGRDKALGVSVPDEVFGAFMERLAKCG